MRGFSGPTIIATYNFDPDFVLEELRKFHEMKGMPLELIEPVLDLILSTTGQNPIIRTRVMLIKTRRRKFVTYSELEDLVYSILFELHRNSSEKHAPAKQDSFGLSIVRQSSWLPEGG